MTKPLAIFLLFAAVLLAQEPEAASFRGMVRLNRAPVSNEVLQVKLPRAVDRQLPNGLKLVILESHRAPTISLTIDIPSTHLRDPQNLPGVAEATAALMMLGTTSRNARQISEALADIGATLSISAGGGGGGGRGGRGGGGGGGVTGTISLSSLTENFDAALAIMGDVLLHPSFPADEFDKWKARQRNLLEQQRTAPATLSSEKLMQVLYPDDARHFRLTAESLDKITREHLVEHYKKFYVPTGQLAGVVGDITPKDAVAKIEKVLAAWKGGAVEPVTLGMAAPIAEKKVYLISRPGSVQTDLTLANRAIERTNPDYLACMVMNQVLGSGPAARLFRIIREEKGYTYGVSSSFSASKVMQHFSAALSVRTEVTEAALADMLKEFRDIRDVPVPQLELDGAKRTLVARFALDLESPAGVLSRWTQQREYGLPEDYWDTYTTKIMAVTAADVARVAKKYVPYDNVQIVAVGDGAKIRDLLKKFGPVEESSAAPGN
jgi:zinc protease